MTRTCASIAVMVAILTAAGCLERKETITVRPDGGVDMEVEHSSESQDDLYEGDAIPTLDRGWIVEETTETDNEGQQTFRLRAVASFPDSPLPRHYASLHDPAPEMSLQFPTTITIEQRDGATWYHFRRVYEARAWAYLAAPEERLQNEVEEMLDDRDFTELNLDERRNVLESAVEIEVLKHRTLARMAFLDVLPEVPQDVWLAVHAAIEAPAREVDLVRIAEMMGTELEPEQEQELDDMGQQLEASMLAAMQKSIIDADLSRTAVNEITERFDYHKRYHQINEDLGDDAFEITVKMPGRIVGHNADERSGSSVTWSFGGDFVRDRTVELMVSSRLP